MKKLPTYNVPFSIIGLHDYPAWFSCYNPRKHNWEHKDELPMIPAFTFEATLEYKGYQRGRSAATFCFESIDGEHIGKTFPVQISNMSQFIPLMDKGKITEKFLTRKQGQNFGLELVV